MSQTIAIPFIKDKDILKFFLYRLYESSFRTTDFEGIHITEENSESESINITFEKAGLYSLKIYSILSQHEHLILEVNHAEPDNQTILSTVQKWVTDDNIEIARHLDSSMNAASELEKFERVLEQFCKLNNLQSEPKDPTGKNDRVKNCYVITSDDKDKPLTITSFKNGTIMTQGSYTKLHKAFWQLFLNAGKEILEIKQ